jgi:hypothetical protein
MIVLNFIILLSHFYTHQPKGSFMMTVIKQNWSYFLISTIVIAFIGMSASKIVHGEFQVIHNLIDSIIGGFIFAYFQSKRH